MDEVLEFVESVFFLVGDSEVGEDEFAEVDVVVRVVDVVCVGSDSIDGGDSPGFGGFVHHELAGGEDSIFG